MFSTHRCLNYTFYLEIIVESHAVVRNNTKRSRVPFTHSPPVVTSCNTMAQYHHQDIDIGTVKIQRALVTKTPQVALAFQK